MNIYDMLTARREANKQGRAFAVLSGGAEPERAAVLRSAVERAAISLPDEEALEAQELFPAWAAGVSYAALDRVRYDGSLYRCEQAHTSQDGWEPDKTPALWTQIAKPGEIPVWRQPTGAQDAYRIGEKVHYPDQDGPIYVSEIDYNTYQPGVYGWALSEEESV